MRHNGHGVLTLEDSRTWIEETGLCLFLPKRQFSTSLAPSFVEAVAGHHNAAPDPRQIAAAEELLVRLELDGVAVRLNLLGHPGEQPDYVVAAWVLPYVYALRGDRDWRRSPQLTGSRQVSPLAIQAYKRLEAGDATIAELVRALGQGVSETAVLRAITELWQQLRIIPAVSAPGQPAQWQLLRHRYQKAIAEGASTSQVTAISVLASIFLQAVIAASMEEVEMFLSPLTARSKIREVIRGLVATRQVHTLSLGHAPHYYVAGTLPEFAPAPSLFTSSVVASYFPHFPEHEEILPEPSPEPVVEPEPVAPAPEVHAHSNGARRPASTGKPSTPRPHFGNRPAARDRKPAQSASSGRPARRSSESRSTSARPAAANRSASSSRFSSNGTKGAHGPATRNANGKVRAGLGSSTPKPAQSNGNGHSSHAANGSRPAANGKSAPPPRNGATRTGVTRSSATAPRKDARNDARSSRSDRKSALSAGAAANKRFGYAAKQGTKKRG